MGEEDESIEIEENLFNITISRHYLKKELGK